MPLTGNSRRPILITGSHKSGSTWVGKMIAASPAIGYIWEPFNPAHSRAVFDAATDRYYTWVSDRNGHLYEAALSNTLGFKYDMRAGAMSFASAKELAKMLIDYARSQWYRAKKRRPLLKDPMALFAAEWIAARFDAQVVVLVRHPAAFVHSVIRGNLRHPFAHFLEQPELMAERLAPFRAEIECLARKKIDIVDEATLLWRTTHHMIMKYRQAHPDWLFVRHEDLSADPLTGFERIFGYLGLDYTSGVKRTIEAYTREGNPVERPRQLLRTPTKLDSRKNTNQWARHLTVEQIDRIRRRSEDVWPAFYAADDWEAELLPVGAALSQRRDG